MWLLDDDGEYTEEVDPENFRNLSLIEIQVSGDFSTDLLQTISQGDRTTDDQVAYMEYYLDPMGMKLLSEQEAVNTTNRRICFFMHFTDPNKSFNIGSEVIVMPSASDLPERLQPFTHYIPDD